MSGGLSARSMARLVRLRSALDRKADAQLDTLRAAATELKMRDKSSPDVMDSVERAARKAAVLAAAEYTPLSRGVALHGHSRLRSVMMALENEDRTESVDGKLLLRAGRIPLLDDAASAEPKSTVRPVRSGTVDSSLHWETNAVLSLTQSMSEPDSDQSQGEPAGHAALSARGKHQHVRQRASSLESHSSASVDSAEAREWRSASGLIDSMVLGRHADWQLRLWRDGGKGSDVDVFSGAATAGSQKGYNRTGRGKGGGGPGGGKNKKKVKGARRRERDRLAAERAQEKIR